MDLNSLLFPAPNSSYRIGRVHGELIWIPKTFINEENTQRLHTAPDMPSSPLFLNSSSAAKKINKKNSKFQPCSSNSRTSAISSSTATSSNALISEKTNKLVEKADIFSFANQINAPQANANSPSRNIFKLQLDNVVLKSKGDEENESADEKLVGPEETPLAGSLKYYSKTPKSSHINQQPKTERKLSSEAKKANLIAEKQKVLTINEKSVQPDEQLLQNSSRYQLDQNRVSSKNIRVIENNLSLKVDHFNQNVEELKPKSPTNSSKNEKVIIKEAHPLVTSSTNSTKKTIIGGDARKPRKSNREPSTDRIGDFSNPPTVRAVYQQCYMYPKACLQMASRLTPPPNQRLEVKIPLKNENTPKSSRSRIPFQGVSPSVHSAQTPTHNSQLTNRALKPRIPTIPCMLLRSGFKSSKLMIYFHGNGEDINLSFELLSHVRNHLRIHVLAVEYPGYGIYKGTPNEAGIFEDAELVYDYLVGHVKVDPKEIIIFGRSIGSGPASYLASRKYVGALVLMSAFTSIRALTKDLAGLWAKYLIRERFDNLTAITKVNCPTFFIHGQQDALIPYSHSKHLHGKHAMIRWDRNNVFYIDACKGPSELFLPKKMNHVELDVLEDFVFPLIGFLHKCGFKDEKPEINRISFPRKLFECPEPIKPATKMPHKSLSPIR